MTSTDFVHPPTYEGAQFRCPRCNVVAQQEWSEVYMVLGKHPNQPNMLTLNSRLHPAEVLKVSCCYVCKRFSVWQNMTPVWPSSSQISPPSEDMPVNVREHYEEARSVYNLSPKSAAALLRLAIQHLCIDLGGSGKNINEDIGLLVRNGLPEKIRKALDVVRVIGNNAVHPGLIAIDDNPGVVAALFKLVNMIVDDMITEPAEVQTMFEALPTGAKEAIDKRDS
jgi:hypothetical protein